MMSPDDKARIFINIEVGYSQTSFLYMYYSLPNWVMCTFLFTGFVEDSHKICGQARERL